MDRADGAGGVCWISGCFGCLAEGAWSADAVVGPVRFVGATRQGVGGGVVLRLQGPSGLAGLFNGHQGDGWAIGEGFESGRSSTGYPPTARALLAKPRRLFSLLIHLGG